jgi:hypothetical protein
VPSTSEANSDLSGSSARKVTANAAATTPISAIGKPSPSGRSGPGHRERASGRMRSRAEGLVHPQARRPGACSSTRQRVDHPAKDYSPSPWPTMPCPDVIPALPSPSQRAVRRCTAAGPALAAIGLDCLRRNLAAQVSALQHRGRRWIVHAPRPAAAGQPPSQVLDGGVVRQRAQPQAVAPGGRYFARSSFPAIGQGQPRSRIGATMAPVTIRCAGAQANEAM